VRPTAGPAAWLGTVARSLAEAPELWWPKVRRETGQRWYEPLVATDECEAWLLGWPVGEGIELHDHGDSSGAVFVVEGRLRETYVAASDWMRPGGHLRHRQLSTGALVTFGPGHVHDVLNGGDRQALSIHVYSPRLRSMTFYEHRPDRGLAAVRTERSRPDLVLV
ncbi:MAG TPA: cysteine dioxygenase family protein, partial [Acidimicrobiia bacterium]|nr:cysteine dioxygenase family protein [Acidimicrobiia bacterium]